MKHTVLKLMAGWGLVFAAQAESTVRLNNQDAQKPVVLWYDGRLAYEGVYVQVCASIAAGPWWPVASVEGAREVFPLSEPGYFDAGVGVVPFVVPERMLVDFQVFAWQGTADGWDDSVVKGQSVKWNQWVGSWDPGSGLPASGPVLEIPGNIVLYALPEPNSIALGILGGLALMVRRWKVAKIPGK